MKKNKVILSVTNDLNSDQRVHKMCLYLLDRGYEPILIGRRKNDSSPMEARPYKCIRMKLAFEKGALFYAAYNFRLFFLLLFKKNTSLHANDLDSLFANFLVSKIRRKSLVYDSHEYFTEVPELIHRPKVKAVWEKIERFIFPKLNNIITVNDSIAMRYEEKYTKQIRVVRNISKQWKEVQIPTKQELGIPIDSLLLIIQGAGLNVDRGIEEAVLAMHNLEGFTLLIVGDGDVIPRVKMLVEKEMLSKKVRFFGKRPYSELMYFTSHADLGLSLDKDTNPNYQFSLPNKIFDYIHTSTPLLVSNRTEVEKIVRDYEVGKVINTVTSESISEAVKEIFSLPEKYKTYKSNCSKAAELLHWEKEVSVLDDWYPKIN